MYFGFSYIGLIVFILPMIINIFYAFFPPIDEQKADKNSRNDTVLSKLGIVENICRVLYCAVLCVLLSKKAVVFSSALLFVAVAFLVLYYIVWICYFLSGRKAEYMTKSFLLVPVPLAVFPVIYYFCAALWLCNIPAACIMAVFGVVHNFCAHAQSRDNHR